MPSTSTAPRLRAPKAYQEAAMALRAKYHADAAWT
jgi:hypothetical protein